MDEINSNDKIILDEPNTQSSQDNKQNSDIHVYTIDKMNKYMPIYKTLDNIFYYISNMSIILLSGLGIFILYNF